MVLDSRLVWWGVCSIVVGALLFQVGHLFEHFYQVYHYLFVTQERVFMSPIAHYIEDIISAWLFPEFGHKTQMVIAKEILHFTGDSIFLVGIAAFLVLLQSRLLLWAFWVQAFHTYEHVSLTLSAILTPNNTPIGMSTLYGAHDMVSATFFNGWLVSWHFIMNMIPSVLVALVLWGIIRSRHARNLIHK